MKVQMLFAWKRKNSLTEKQVFYFFFCFSNTNIILIKETNTLHKKTQTRKKFLIFGSATMHVNNIFLKYILQIPFTWKYKYWNEKSGGVWLQIMNWWSQEWLCLSKTRLVFVFQRHEYTSSLFCGAKWIVVDLYRKIYERSSKYDENINKI